MRITKIKNIKNLRNIIDFNSDIALDKNTIIYAPNGSGKTNISRLFSYISDKENVQHLLSQEQKTTPNAKVSFSIETNNSFCIDEESFKDTNSNFNILVFNSDYVEKNIKCSDFSNKDMSGNVQIAIGDLTNQIIKAEKDIEIKKGDIKKHFSELKSNFDTFSSDYIEKYNKQQKNIWTEFSLDKITTIDNTGNVILSDRTYLEDIDLQKLFIDCENKFTKLYSLSSESILSFDQEELSF